MRTRIKNSIVVVILVLAPLGGLRGQEEAVSEPPVTSWSNAEGKVLEADFVRMTDDAVVLKLKRDGREVSVPLSLLSIESHYHALKLANPEAFSKPLIKAEVAPPFEIPEATLVVEDVIKSPFPSSPTIEQFIEITQREIDAGNGMVVWHSLPPKMQTDVENVIVQAVQKIGPQTLSQLKVIFRDVNTLLTQKKEFILGHPFIKKQGFASQLEDAWPLLSAYVQALTEESLWDESNFQTGNLIPWMAKMTVIAAPFNEPIQNAVRDFLPAELNLADMKAKYTIVSQSAESAEVELQIGEMPPQKQTLTKFGDTWIDATQMSSVRTGLDTALTEIEKFDSAKASALRGSIGLVVAAVGGLARANSQEDFNSAVQNLTDLAGGLAGTVGVLPAGALGQAEGNRAGGGQRGNAGRGGGRPGPPGTSF